MKKLGLLFVVMITFLVLPFSVLAETADDNSSDNVQQNAENNNKSQDRKVKVYFFRGETCPHCAQAEKFFESIQEEYGHLFEIRDYEVYNNASNSKLMDQLAEMRGDNERRGIPYIIIGNKSWTGYASELDSAIIEAIKAEYEVAVEDRYDVMDLIQNDDDKADYSNDVMFLIIILTITAGIVSGVMFARKKTV